MAYKLVTNVTAVRFTNVAALEEVFTVINNGAVTPLSASVAYMNDTETIVGVTEDPIEIGDWLVIEDELGDEVMVFKRYTNTTFTAKYIIE